MTDESIQFAANEPEPSERTTIWKLRNWEEFVEKIAEFDDADRDRWDETWFRGQSNAEWALDTTLERRSKQRRSVESYFELMRSIKPTVETFTGIDFTLPEPSEIRESQFDTMGFETMLRGSARYMAHLRHGAFPSPLLDWSHSPFVAAYFAFYDARHDGDVAVFAYRERPQNMKIGGIGIPQIISFGPKIKTHKRHFRQQSRYTACVRVDRDNKWYFEPHENVFGVQSQLQQDLLWKITIPARERRKALRFFDKVNLNEFTLFDTEEGLLEMLAVQEIDMRDPS